MSKDHFTVEDFNNARKLLEANGVRKPRFVWLDPANIEEGIKCGLIVHGVFQGLIVLDAITGEPIPQT